MFDDLLTKERKFRKLNHELQLKISNMMKKVDSIIYVCADNNLLNNANQLQCNFVMKDVNAKNYSENIALKIDKQSKMSLFKVPEIPSIENVNNIEILLKKDNVGSEAIITLFKSNVNMLYKELQVIQFEYNKKCDYCKELEVENKTLDNIQVKLYNQIEILNDTIMKLENINSDTLSNCQVVSSENIILKKNLETFKKEIKILNQQSTNYNTRLNRSLENNEKLKNALKCGQVEKKELRNQIKKLQEDKKLALKNLANQRLELIHMFKKQMLIIDNLKRQNMHLMANGQICITEEDFIKLLEWKPYQI